MNYKNELREKLKEYKREDIIIKEHAQIQAVRRGIELEEVIANILNPQRLQVAMKQKALKENEEKYDCYFGYSNTQCQRYVLVLHKQCEVCTVIKINRRWQKIAEKNAGI